MLKIYGVPISVHTRKVIVAMIVKNLPYELVPVVPVMPDNLPPNWRQLSPTGRIPTLVDGDFVLSDSAAICAYLERLQPQPSLYPQDAKAFAQAFSLEQYAGTLFGNLVHPLFHEVVVNPKMRSIPTNTDKVNEILSSVMPEMFGYLDGIATREYLAGSSLSVADIAVVSNLLNYQYIGFELQREKFPRLAALFERIIRHPAVNEALRREQAAVDSMGLSKGFLGTALA